MIKPVSYLQRDSRWKNHNYSAKGEKKTIGSSGCGVAAAAMVIATLKDRSVTPVTTAEWSMAHGYKALNQGTYYSYFVPQLAAYGIACRQLNSSSLYGIPSSPAHTEALNALQRGDWIIACMGKGNWTSSGHFILVYGYENGSIYVNDPASTAASRLKNTWALFSRQVKTMWSVSVPADSSENIMPGLTAEKTKVTYLSHRIPGNTWGSEITGYNTVSSMGYSGSFGKAIDKIAIRLSQGVITYSAHRLNGGWGRDITGFSTTDTNKYAGSAGKAIDAVTIKATGITGTLKYRVHRKTDNKWGNWITGYSKTDTNRYAGSFGKEIDAIQIGIE